MANGAKNWLRGRRVVLLTSEIWISKIRASRKSIYMICQSQPLSIGGFRHFVGSPLQKKGGAKKGESDLIAPTRRHVFNRRASAFDRAI